MSLINLFFFAHQPERLRPYPARRSPSTRDVSKLRSRLFDDELNETIFHKVAEKCYYPATRLILEMVRKHQHDEKPFKVSYGLSGTFLAQAERFAPDLLDIFRELAATGCVEFTGETYYHSLAGLWGDERTEFMRQVKKHIGAIERLFGQTPHVFRNTECLYNNGIAGSVQQMGFSGIMTEGVDWLMQGWRSPDFLYQSTTGLPVLLRNYRLSDDLGYRFSNRGWEGYPLTSETFAGWMAGNTDEVINIMIDYEALGEHMWADTGIFDFMRYLPDAIKRYPQLAFSTPTEIVQTLQPKGTIDVGPFSTISWADQERDTSAWLRNEMQQFCFEELKVLESLIMETDNEEVIECWRLLQTSDHLYYLSDKSLTDGDVHAYFSAYGSLFESFVRLYTAINAVQESATYLVQQRISRSRKSARAKELDSMLYGNNSAPRGPVTGV